MNRDRRNFLKTVGVAVCASAMPVSVAAASAQDPLSLENILRNIADQTIRSVASPGVQISVWQGRNSIAETSAGFGNIETSTPVSSDTVFRAGSLTKQFTAALIATLQVAVAYIPLAIDHEINDFMVNKCMVGSECLNHSMPLIVQIGLIGLGARILLWPLVAWHLGGRLLWRRFCSNCLLQSG